ncbi:MAG: hypothetical protein WAM72_06395, partial [Xanthobacteraceae bacterium]
RPIGSLPLGHAAPEPAPNPAAKVEQKQPTQSYYRFLEAVHRGDRRRAEFYTQKCRDEGLPEAQLKEVSLLDTYQTSGRRGPEPIKKAAVEKAMWAYIGQEGAKSFFKMKKEECAVYFKTSATTAWEVRSAIKNSDKLRQLRPTPTNNK